MQTITNKNLKTYKKSVFRVKHEIFTFSGGVHLRGSVDRKVWKPLNLTHKVSEDTHLNFLKLGPTRQ